MALSLTGRGAYDGVATSYSASTSTTKVTQSFTPSNNSLLCVVMSMGNEDGDADLANFTIAGGSLTWVEIASVKSTTSGSYQELIKAWYAKVATAASMQVTITHPSLAFGSGDYQMQLHLFDVSGGYSVGSPIGGKTSELLSGSGADSVTLDATPAASSIVVGSLANAPNAGVLTATPGTGWTELYDTALSGVTHHQTQHITGHTSTTVAWVDIAVGGTVYDDDNVALAFEVKEAAAVSTGRSHGYIIG